MTMIPVSFSTKLVSPLPGVSALAWTQFISALDIQSANAASISGGFGSYDLRPRRLVEIGYGKNLRNVQKGGRNVAVCEFIAPMTRKKFLEDPLEQYKVLARSILLYHEDLTRGVIQKPADVSMAGALAILHRGGKGALSSWPNLFPHTRALYEAVQGVF